MAGLIKQRARTDEFALQRTELMIRQLKTEPPAAAVRDERDMAGEQAEGVGDAFHLRQHVYDFAFAEVIAAAVGAKLLDFPGEFLHRSA